MSSRYSRDWVYCPILTSQITADDSHPATRFEGNVFVFQRYPSRCQFHTTRRWSRICSRVILIVLKITSPKRRGSDRSVRERFGAGSAAFAGIRSFYFLSSQNTRWETPCNRRKGHSNLLPPPPLKRIPLNSFHREQQFGTWCQHIRESDSGGKCCATELRPTWRGYFHIFPASCFDYDGVPKVSWTYSSTPTFP